MKTDNTLKARPHSIVFAAKLQVLCVIFSLVALLFDFIHSPPPFNLLVVQLSISAAYFIFPFMILRGVDLFRFIFVALEGVTAFIYLTSEVEIPVFSTIALFCQMPLVGYTLFSLFTKESNDWFDLVRLNKSLN